MALDFISNFVTEYFVNPINHPESYAPYNVVNTLTFAVVALIAIYLIYKFLNKHGIETNEKFYWALIPYIFFGSIVRVLSDAQVLPRVVEIFGITFYPFITPSIYALIFLITITALFISRKFENWHEIFSNTGWLLSIVSLLPLVFLFKNFLLFSAIMGIVVFIALVLFYAPFKTSLMEKGIILSQSFDGAATFISVSYGGYFEQHVLGNLIFDYVGGPFAFLIVKILFALLVVYVLRRESNKKEVAYISLLITLFGLAPGARDALRLLAGV